MNRNLNKKTKQSLFFFFFFFFYLDVAGILSWDWNLFFQIEKVAEMRNQHSPQEGEIIKGISNKETR